MENETLNEEFVVDYINKHLNPVIETPLLNQGRLDQKELEKAFPDDFIILTYLSYKRENSLIRRYTSLLNQLENGYIQPLFSINSASSIYTAKPSIQIPHADLALFLDCDCHHFDTLEEAINALSNAKGDLELITVIKKTVYFRNEKYRHKKEDKRQEVLNKYNKSDHDFIPFVSYYNEVELEWLGLSHLIE